MFRLANSYVYFTHMNTIYRGVENIRSEQNHLFVIWSVYVGYGIYY